jgi:hypothetical protein
MATTNDKAVRDLVKAIHDSPGRVMLVTAGAGTRALAWILGVAGASRTLLEALTLYDESSFDDFLGRKPAKYVVARTAGLLAGRAVVRARHLYRGDEPVIGLACSATIITDRPKRGQHRAHIAVRTAGTVDRYVLYMHKGERDRRGEEEMVSLVIMNALSGAYNLGIELPLPLVDGDRYSRVCNDISGETQKILDGEDDFFGIRADGRFHGRRSAPKAILSGAFNPLHEGHIGLAATAADILGCEVTFELAALNAGKPSPSIEHIKQRLLQFAGKYAVLVSNSALFAAKARLYPGATFVVGVDTAQRVLQPRYYDDNTATMFAALNTIKDSECGFLVAGRVNERGDYMPAADLEIPEQYAGLFTAIPGDRFRIDLSSTTLRAQDASASPN